MRKKLVISILILLVIYLVVVSLGFDKIFAFLGKVVMYYSAAGTTAPSQPATKLRLQPVPMMQRDDSSPLIPTLSKKLKGKGIEVEVEKSDLLTKPTVPASLPSVQPSPETRYQDVTFTKGILRVTIEHVPEVGVQEMMSVGTEKDVLITDADNPVQAFWISPNLFMLTKKPVRVEIGRWVSVLGVVRLQTSNDWYEFRRTYGEGEIYCTPPSPRCSVRVQDGAIVLSLPEGLSSGFGLLLQDVGSAAMQRLLRPNNPPTHDDPILRASTARNLSVDDLQCLNQNTRDPDNDPVVNIFGFLVNNNKYAVVALPFEGHSSDNLFAIDYGATSSRRADVTNATFNISVGAIGAAYIFDSVNNSFINLSSSNDVIFASAENFTVEVWVNATSRDGVVFAKQVRGILNTGDSVYALRVVDGRVEFSFVDSFTGANLRTLSSRNRFIVDGLYHYLAVRRDRRTNLVELFVDGVGVDAVPDNLVAALGNNNADFVIGSLNKSAEFINGTIDEVRVYKRALSLLEIQSHQQLRYDVVKETETVRGEAWKCEVTPSDGYDVGVTKTSGFLIVRNTPPLHDQPLIVGTPSGGRDNDNLTCVNQNTRDPDGDRVLNIYSFLVNSGHFTQVHLPFEAHDERAVKIIDYSRASNGSVSGTAFRNTTGPIPSGAYDFDGVDDTIQFPKGVYNTTSSVSLEVWFNITAYKDSATLLVKGGSTLTPVPTLAYGLRLGQGNPAVGGRQDELELFYGNASLSSRISVFGTAGADIIPNQFYHVVVRKPTGAALPDFYVNGARISSICLSSPVVTCAKSLARSNESLVLGFNSIFPTGTYFKGVLDFVAVYNRTISAEFALLRNFTRNNLMPPEETFVGQQWACQVTPNDGFEDGVTLESSSLDILADRIRPPPSELGERTGLRLPNYTFDVRTQETAAYTLFSNHRVKILGVGRGIFVLVFDRIYDLGGFYTGGYRKKAVLFLVPRVGTIELFEGESVDLDLDGFGSYDITVRILSIADGGARVQLSRYGYRRGEPYVPPPIIIPLIPQLPPELMPGAQVTPPAERAVEEPTVLRPRINYGTVGVIALLIAIIAVLIIVIRKIKV